MNSYTILAKYYDKLSYDCDYEKWSQYLYCLIKKHQKVIGKGADAACGSGKLTILLKKAGLDIFGFDLSTGMLNAAFENAEKSGVNIDFIIADLNNFKSHTLLSFITCANDGINYVKKDKILSCFKNLYNNLSKGGMLLFDISSSYKLRKIIGNSTFSDDNKEVTYIWNNSLENNQTELHMDLIFFVSKGLNYLRFDENHIQYIYEADFIKENLQKAGFKDILLYDFLSEEPPATDSKRIQFAAFK